MQQVLQAKLKIIDNFEVNLEVQTVFDKMKYMVENIIVIIGTIMITIKLTFSFFFLMYCVSEMSILE